MQSNIEKKCKSKGVKLTDQRRIIAKVMSESNDHPNVDELYNRVSKIDEKIIDHQIAIIRSMTKNERAEPDILKASRKKRIASGSGRQVNEVNRLLKQFEQTKKIMKQAQKPGFANKLKNLLGGNQMPTID